MTAVVLAGGRGRRLQTSDPSRLRTEAQRRAAASGLKVMMPVDPAGERPFLDYVLDALAGAGCTDAVIVVPPRHAELRDHLQAAPPSRLRVRLAVQAVADGTAGAVLAAAPAVAAPWFLVVNGDNGYPVDDMRALWAVDGCGLAAFTRRSLMTTSGFPAAKVAAFAAVERDAAGRLMGLVEKPPVETIERADDQALLSMNLWKVSPEIFEACRDVAPSARGERELPDAVMLAVRRGVPFRVLVARGRVLDVTTAADVDIVSRALAGVEPRP